jgi:hypothetical protein
LTTLAEVYRPGARLIKKEILAAAPAARSPTKLRMQGYEEFRSW